MESDHMEASGWNVKMKGNLILTRNIGQRIWVGDEIAITILGVNGNQVRLSIIAPTDIPVHRDEIYQRIKQEKDYV